MQIVEQTRLLMTKVLEEDGGGDTGWTETGGLLTAHNLPRLQQYKRNVTVSLTNVFELACKIHVTVVPIQFLYRRFPYPDSTTPIPLPTIPLLRFPPIPLPHFPYRRFPYRRFPYHQFPYPNSPTDIESSVGELTGNRRLMV